MRIDTLLWTAHAIGWATYVGGSLTMELVLRHAQQSMRPSQVAVVCQRAGLRYRWFGLASLVTVGATGVLQLLRLDEAALATRAGSPALSLADPYGRTVLLLAVLWLVLAAIWSVMTFWLHPAMHARFSAEMSKEQAQGERQRIGVQIRRMDRSLRAELTVALLALIVGATLRLGGIV